MVTAAPAIPWVLPTSTHDASDCSSGLPTKGLVAHTHHLSPAVVSSCSRAPLLLSVSAVLQCVKSGSWELARCPAGHMAGTVTVRHTEEANMASGHCGMSPAPPVAPCSYWPRVTHGLWVPPWLGDTSASLLTPWWWMGPPAAWPRLLAHGPGSLVGMRWVVSGVCALGTLPPELLSSNASPCLVSVSWGVSGGGMGADNGYQGPAWAVALCCGLSPWPLPHQPLPLTHR